MLGMRENAMSDTPRADALFKEAQDFPRTAFVVLLEDYRKIERELIATQICAGVASKERGEWAEERFVLLARLKACRGD